MFAYCVPDTICFELIKGLPVALAALIVGIVASWIAYRQSQIAHATLNLALFNRRLEIFHKTWECLSAEVIGTPQHNVFHSPIDNLIPEASFIFGAEVAEYMRTVSRKISELALINMRTKGNGNIVRPEDIANDAELLNWFVNEARVGVRGVFGKYLDFGKWR